MLGALIIRETRATFGTSQLGYLWEIITPVAMVAILIALFTALGRHPPFGESMALFFTTGIIPLFFFRKMGMTMMKAFDANKALLAYPPIKETDTLFARAALIILTYCAITWVLFGGLIALGLASAPDRAEVVFEAMAATAALGFGFGVANAVILAFWLSWDKIITMAMRPLFYFSAIFYVPSRMPPYIVDVLEWNPVLHLIEWLREGYYPNYESTIVNPAYPLGIALVLTLVGLAGERATRGRREKVRP